MFLLVVGLCVFGLGFFTFPSIIDGFLIDPTGETERECIENKQAGFLKIFILYANYNMIILIWK